MCGNEQKYKKAAEWIKNIEQKYKEIKEQAGAVQRSHPTPIHSMIHHPEPIRALPPSKSQFS